MNLVEPDTAEAITFWPRSWPSWPILATRMRGRRPCSVSKASISSLMRLMLPSMRAISAR